MDTPPATALRNSATPRLVPLAAAAASILAPRRHHGHVAMHVGTASPLLAPSAPPLPAPRQPYGGGVIQANGGGSVLILPTATRAQLLELRQHLDAALAATEQREAAHG